VIEDVVVPIDPLDESRTKSETRMFGLKGCPINADHEPDVRKLEVPLGRATVSVTDGGFVMRVFNSTIGKVKEGQMEGAVGVAGEAAKLVGRHGGAVRFFLAGAGEEVNSTLFSIEYDSPETMGQAFDALADDAELQAFVTRLNGPQSPSVITSQSMGMEVPIGRTPKSGTGRILEAHTSRVNPGRMEEAISQSADVCEFVEANGAVNARLLQLTYAGLGSGLTILAWELENMQAHARLGSAWFAKAGLALQAKSMTANPASVPVASGLWNEIPL
jgi:hypothetical protein